MTRYTEGFSHFVTSMTAPVASGWSVGRVGLAPTGKRRLTTAHTHSGHCLVLGLRPDCLTLSGVGLPLGHEALGFGELVGGHFSGKVR